MTAVFWCPDCQIRRQIPEKFLGKKGRCPKCQSLTTVISWPAEEIPVHDFASLEAESEERGEQFMQKPPGPSIDPSQSSNHSGKGEIFAAERQPQPNLPSQQIPSDQPAKDKAMPGSLPTGESTNPKNSGDTSAAWPYPGPEDEAVDEAAAVAVAPEQGAPEATAREGTILKFLNPNRTCGLISADNKTFWFHRTYFRRELDHQHAQMSVRVAFRSRPSSRYPDKMEAFDIVLMNEPDTAPLPDFTRNAEDSDNSSHKLPLYQWAYLGYEPKIYEQLANMTLPERWHYLQQEDPEHEYPILHHYLHYTFSRLLEENKVLTYTPNGKPMLAAFNTGLVDRRYEPIHMLFEPNPQRDQYEQQWVFKCFCIAGESHGKDLVRFFPQLPQPAQYCHDPADLLYDVDADLPILDFQHILQDNIHRLPTGFLERHCTADLISQARSDDGYDFNKLRELVDQNSDSLNRMKDRLHCAVALAVKRARWNFKTAIPQYYPRHKRVDLLLPLCLVEDRTVDIALVVEKTISGKYLGHTVLPLDWAYNNARLVCRPDSDWLTPGAIQPSNNPVEV